MTDWLAVLSEDNWEISGGEGLLGLGRDAERRLNRMSDQDRVWTYVNRKYVDHQTPWVREIRAVVRVAGPVRHLATSPWRPRGGQQFTVARPITIEHRCALPALECEAAHAPGPGAGPRPARCCGRGVPGPRCRSWRR
jgi:hypothetical protein